MAHKLNAQSVVLTDGDTDTLKTLRDNVQRNIKRTTTNEEKLENKNESAVSHLNSTIISCQQLVWGNQEQVDSFKQQVQTFDTIIGSDIIYVEEILNPLFDTVRQLLDEKDGKFLLSYARRNVSIDLVFATATKYGFIWEEPPHTEGVFIFQRTVE